MDLHLPHTLITFWKGQKSSGRRMPGSSSLLSTVAPRGNLGSLHSLVRKLSSERACWKSPKSAASYCIFEWEYKKGYFKGCISTVYCKCFTLCEQESSRSWRLFWDKWDTSFCTEDQSSARYSCSSRASQTISISASCAFLGIIVPSRKWSKCVGDEDPWRPLLQGQMHSLYRNGANGHSTSTLLSLRAL